MSSISEAISLIDETNKLYLKNEDLQYIEKIREIHESISQTHEKKQQELRTIIKELNLRLKRAEASATRTSSFQDHQANMRKLDEEKSNIQSAITSLEIEQQAIRQSLNLASLDLKHTEEKNDSLLRRQHSGLPHAEVDLQLYRNLTGIEWDYQSNNVRGFILCQPNDVQPFDYDTTTLSKFEIINSLWDLLDNTLEK